MTVARQRSFGFRLVRASLIGVLIGLLGLALIIAFDLDRPAPRPPWELDDPWGTP